MDDHEINAELERMLFGKSGSELHNALIKKIQVPKGGPDVERLVTLCFKGETLRDHVRVVLAKTNYQERLDLQRNLNAIADRSPAMADMLEHCATSGEVQALNVGLRSWIEVFKFHEMVVQFTAWCEGKHPPEEWKYVPVLADEIKETLTAVQELAPLRDVTLKLLANIALRDLKYREVFDKLKAIILELEVEFTAIFAEIN